MLAVDVIGQLMHWQNLQNMTAGLTGLTSRLMIRSSGPLFVMNNL
jgi:hypothetical protein